MIGGVVSFLLAAALAFVEPLQGAEVAPVDGAAVAELRAEALVAWQARDRPGELERAVALWRRAATSEPKDYETLVSLAYGLHVLGERQLADGEEGERPARTFEEGAGRALEALRLSSPDFADCLGRSGQGRHCLHLVERETAGAVTLYGGNLARYAKAAGVAAMWRHRAEIQAAGERAVGLDERAFQAAPHRLLGSFYARAPGWAGGDLERSRAHFDKALELEPGHFGTRLLYAEEYARKAKDRDLFERLLREVLAGDPDEYPEIAPEQRTYQTLARRLLEMAPELFTAPSAVTAESVAGTGGEDGAR